MASRDYADRQANQMGTTRVNHDAITAALGGVEQYGKGITPNPFASQEAEWVRRIQWAPLRQKLTDKITSIFEPRFITPPPTSECIEALITMTDSRLILEIGTCTGFTALHMLRAIVGKPGAKVVSIDARPAHHREFFESSDIAPWFEFCEGWTPDVFTKLHGRIFSLVFVDSDHSIEHSEKELAALEGITRPGTIYLFHDCPRRQSPAHPENEEGPIYRWLHEKVARGYFRGTVLPTAEQLDCLDTWGSGYPQACNPSLGIFIRQ